MAKRKGKKDVGSSFRKINVNDELAGWIDVQLRVIPDERARRFTAIKVAASFRFAPILLPVTANAPKRPKIIPEAPTANVLSGLNRYEASEPLIRDMNKIKIYLQVQYTISYTCSC